MRHYCTYFDEGYLSRGLVLYRSLRAIGEPFRLWVLALTPTCAERLRALALPDVEVHALEALEAADPELLAVKGSRSRVEYYFTCSPCWPRRVLALTPEADSITYLDADLAFFASPEPLHTALAQGHVSIIPHRFAPRVPARFRRSGVYNVAWLGFRRSAEGLACLDWWRARCLEWCHDRYEPERYADQKYLEGFSKHFPGVVVLDHPGANLAPWNVDGHKLHDGGGVTVDGQPLVFFHYQGLRAVGGGWFDVNLLPYRARLVPVLRDAVYRPYLRGLAAVEAELAGRGLGATALSQRRAGVPALRRWASRIAGLGLAAAHRQLLRID